MGRKSRFEKELTRGGKMLEEDRAAEARDAFLAALKANPGEAEAMSCLGLSYLRLSRFEDAQTVYADLVRARPDDPFHRRNLGLVYLKLGQFEEAQVELERSKDLAALADGGLGSWDGGSGIFERAYKAFVGVAGASVSTEGALFTPAECEAVFEDAWALEAEGTEPSATPATVGLSVSEVGRPVVVSSTQIMSVPHPTTLVVRAGTGALVRCGDLLAVAGNVRFDAVHRRMRGTTSEERFGGTRPFCLVEGAGFVARTDDGGSYTLVSLADEVLYVCEDRVAAFEASLRWENGRIPADPAETPVVQFRGSGLLALHFPTEPIAIEVLESRSLTVGGDQLLAWTGDVVPRPLSARAGDVALLSCMGQGRVFLRTGTRLGPPA